jgi:predicted PurR-regulated permease PerM
MESTNLRERLFFYIIFAILIVLMLLMIEPFLTVLVVSLISVIMLKPVYNYFLERKPLRQRPGLAASATLLSVFLVLVIPVLLIVWVTVNQLSGLLEQLAAIDLNAILQDVQQFLEGLPPIGDLQPPDTSTTDSAQPLIRAAAQAVADFAVSLGSSIPSLIIQGIIFVVVVATLLPVIDTLIPQLEEISPLGPELSELYTRKITAMVESLVLGVFLIAIIQGAVMGFFFWLAGLPYVFLLTILSMLLALIPMVGISWLAIGLAIISVLTGNWVQAVIILVGFYGVVNWIDILLRPRLLSEEASINFALFIVAILGGLAWAGVMGLFYGPILMLLLVTTVEVYAEKYAHEDRNLLGEALGRLGNASKASAPDTCEPEAEAGEGATTSAVAEGPDSGDSIGREESSEA